MWAEWSKEQHQKRLGLAVVGLILLPLQLYSLWLLLTLFWKGMPRTRRQGLTLIITLGLELAVLIVIWSFICHAMTKVRLRSAQWPSQSSPSENGIMTSHNPRPASKSNYSFTLLIEFRVLNSDQKRFGHSR